MELCHEFELTLSSTDGFVKSVSDNMCWSESDRSSRLLRNCNERLGDTFGIGGPLFP